MMKSEKEIRSMYKAILHNYCRYHYRLTNDNADNMTQEDLTIFTKFFWDRLKVLQEILFITNSDLIESVLRIIAEMKQEDNTNEN